MCTAQSPFQSRAARQASTCLLAQQGRQTGRASLPASGAATPNCLGRWQSPTSHTAWAVPPGRPCSPKVHAEAFGWLAGPSRHPQLSSPCKLLARSAVRPAAHQQAGAGTVKMQLGCRAFPGKQWSPAVQWNACCCWPRQLGMPVSYPDSAAAAGTDASTALPGCAWD